MSENMSLEDFMQAFKDAPEKVEYDRKALEGAASYFEEMATMENPAPVAFAQAIRRAIEDQKSGDGWAELAGQWAAECIVYESALRTIKDHPHLAVSVLAEIASDALSKANLNQ